MSGNVEFFKSNQAKIQHAILVLDGEARAEALGMRLAHYRSKQAADKWLQATLVAAADGPDAPYPLVVDRIHLIHKRMTHVKFKGYGHAKTSDC